MKSIAFDEPIVYLSISLIILTFGTWLSFVIHSPIPLLVMGVPLGWILRNVAKDEMDLGKRWFRYVIIASVILAVTGITKDWMVVTLTSIFIIIITACSIYDYKISYKKKGRK